MYAGLPEYRRTATALRERRIRSCACSNQRAQPAHRVSASATV